MFSKLPFLSLKLTFHLPVRNNRQTLTHLALVLSFYFNDLIYLSIFKLVEEYTEHFTAQSMVEFGRYAFILKSVKAKLMETKKGAC